MGSSFSGRQVPGFIWDEHYGCAIWLRITIDNIFPCFKFDQISIFQRPLIISQYGNNYMIILYFERHFLEILGYRCTKKSFWAVLSLPVIIQLEYNSKDNWFFNTDIILNLVMNESDSNYFTQPTATKSFHHSHNHSQIWCIITILALKTYQNAHASQPLPTQIQSWPWTG
jgi:hypothetical protein